MQIIVEPPTDLTVCWYTPRAGTPMWYIHAVRPRRRSGEFDGVEYCILAQLDGTTPSTSVRYRVSPYCGVPSRHLAVFSSRQHAEAIRHTRVVAALAYRRAIGPRTQLWWHQWFPEFNDKLRPLHAY